MHLQLPGKEEGGCERGEGMARLGWQGVKRKGGHQGANKARQSKDASCKVVQATPKDVWGVSHIQAQHQHPLLAGRW